MSPDHSLAESPAQPLPQFEGSRRLGVHHITYFAVSASAPMTVLAGGVTTTFAVTGIEGVPLSFLLIGVALAVFAVGYAAMSRHVANAGAFYSYISRGLGKELGVGASFVAVISYNAIQIGLYGLFGAATAMLAEPFGVSLPWWAWAALVWVVVGVLGLIHVELSAKVLAVCLSLEVIAVLLYDIGAFGHPATGTIPLAPLTPAALFVPGLGAVLAFGVAAFIGFEQGAIYSEECRNPRITVARATYAAVAFTSVLYALSSWAMVTTVGADQLQAQATQNGPGLVFGALAQHWGETVSLIANLLFLTSVFAALLSFHNGVARYLFVLGRERVAPMWLRLYKTGARHRAPIGGSLAQSLTAFVVVAAFVIGGADPILALFTWLSGLAAVGVVLLLAATSLAVIGYFRTRPTQATIWQRLIAPPLAALALAALLVEIVVNFDALLGTDPTSPLRWILPGLVLLAAVAGILWGVRLRARPAIYAGIGSVGGPEEDSLSIVGAVAARDTVQAHDDPTTRSQ